jgi:hypothetical protein
VVTGEEILHTLRGVDDVAAPARRNAARVQDGEVAEAIELVASYGDIGEGQGGWREDFQHYSPGRINLEAR